MDEWFFGIFAMKILNSTFFITYNSFFRFVLPQLTTGSSLASFRLRSSLLVLSYKKKRYYLVLSE